MKRFDYCSENGGDIYAIKIFTNFQFGPRFEAAAAYKECLDAKQPLRILHLSMPKIVICIKAQLAQ